MKTASVLGQFSNGILLDHSKNRPTVWKKSHKKSAVVIGQSRILNWVGGEKGNCTLRENRKHVAL